MDDLQRLGVLLAKPEPSRDVVDRGRHRLQRATRGRGRGRGRRTGLLAGGLGAVAVATAAAVVAVTVPGGAPSRPASEPRPSGRQILLAAATTAESRPAGSGIYWHVRTVSDPPADNGRESSTWTRRDGRAWISLKPGLISRLPKRQGFGVAGTVKSFEWLQELPTDPAALTAEIRATVPRFENGPDPDLMTVSGLITLLHRVPAPPRVRAAAFRALASLPQIRSLGKVRGGEGFVYGDGHAGTRLVVDMGTSLVRAEAIAGTGTLSTLTTTSGWTDELPGKVVPLEDQVPPRKDDLVRRPPVRP